MTDFPTRMETPPSTGNEPRLVSTLVTLIGLARLLFLLFKRDAQLVAYIPDDAFYYLVPARNFARLGRWTFDGVEPATGFHLLWGYLLALLFAISPHISLHLILLVAGIVQVGSLAAASYLLTRTSVRTFGPNAGWGIVLIFLSAAVLVQGGWLMESACVIALAAGVVELLARSTIRRGHMLPAGCLLLGWLLELARSDAGLLAFSFFLMHLVLWRRKVVDRIMPAMAALLLVGAVLGLATTLLHTHRVSGQWLQASAQQKFFWTKVSGKISSRRIADKPLSLLQPLHNAIPPFSRHPALFHQLDRAERWQGFATFAVVLLGAFLIARKTSRSDRSLCVPLCVTLVSVVAAYCLLYRYDGDVQDWYVSNFVAPMALLAAAATSWYVRRFPLITKGAVVGFAIAGITFSLFPSYPWQECMYRTGLYLSDRPGLGPVGVFNAGIIAFFDTSPVVNLDGLVNDSILPYTSHGQLTSYLARRNITTIADFSEVLQAPLMQARGGYLDGKLLRCVRSTADPFAADVNNNFADSHLLIYSFDAACLR